MVTRKIWERPYRLRTFPRDLRPNEHESYKFLYKNNDYFGLTSEMFEEHLVTVGEKEILQIP